MTTSDGQHLVIPESERRRAEEHQMAAAIGAHGIYVLSGQIGVQADGSISSDVAEQFDDALRNVETILGKFGAGPEDVIDMTTYHVGLLEHLETFSAARARWLNGALTTWTAIGVVELGRRGALVEVKVMASSPETSPGR